MFESNKGVSKMMTQVLLGVTWPYSRNMALISNVLSIKQNAL
jgi:hypothetical protein